MIGRCDRCATGENWQLIMLSCMDGKECDLEAPLRDVGFCGHDMAIPYFVSFIFFCSFLVRNDFTRVLFTSAIVTSHTLVKTLFQTAYKIRQLLFKRLTLL